MRAATALSTEGDAPLDRGAPGAIEHRTLIRARVMGASTRPTLTLLGCRRTDDPDLRPLTRRGPTQRQGTARYVNSTPCTLLFAQGTLFEPLSL